MLIEGGDDQGWLGNSKYFYRADTGGIIADCNGIPRHCCIGERPARSGCNRDNAGCVTACQCCVICPKSAAQPKGQRFSGASDGVLSSHVYPGVGLLSGYDRTRLLGLPGATGYRHSHSVCSKKRWHYAGTNDGLWLLTAGRDYLHWPGDSAGVQPAFRYRLILGADPAGSICVSVQNDCTGRTGASGVRHHPVWQRLPPPDTPKPGSSCILAPGTHLVDINKQRIIRCLND